MGRAGKLTIAGVVALLALLGGGYAVLSATSSDAPAPASLDASSTTDPAAGSTGGASATRSGSSGVLDGTWKVRADGASFVGYRVREQLTFLTAPNEAVGRTTAVTGTLRIAGNRVEAATVEADLRELASDESRRDNAIRDRGLESESFPKATFELTAPIVLRAAPAKGPQVSTQGQGRLTVHGVNCEVTLT